MKYFDSYILYIVVFLISIFWSWQYDVKKEKIISTKTKILYCVLITLPIVILQGFRYDVGTDYFSYFSLYKGFNEGNKVYLSWYRTEPLFIFLCRITYFVLCGNSIGLFIIDAILINVILFFTFDYYKDEINLPLMYFFYYMLCFPYFLNTERQGLAVIIVWFATKYVHEKKPIKFFCCILIATLFHNTAIIGISFYLVYFLRGKYGKYLKRVFVFLVVTFPFLINFYIKEGLDFVSRNIQIFKKYAKFLRKDMYSTIDATNVNFLFMALMVIVLLIFIQILKESKIGIYGILFLCCAQLLSYLLNSFIDWGFRISFYFELGIMYSYSYVYDKLNNRINKVAILAFVLFTLLFYFTYKFYIQGNCEIFPYQFIWSHK